MSGGVYFLHEHWQMKKISYYFRRLDRIFKPLRDDFSLKLISPLLRGIRFFGNEMVYLVLCRNEVWGMKKGFLSLTPFEEYHHSWYHCLLDKKVWFHESYSQVILDVPVTKGKTTSHINFSFGIYYDLIRIAVCLLWIKFFVKRCVLVKLNMEQRIQIKCPTCKQLPLYKLNSQSFYDVIW